MKQYIITDLPEGLVNITEEQLLEIGGENYEPIIVEEIISKTFTELKALATANELVKGQKYRITDYMTTYKQPVTNATKSSGIIEVLQLTAITTNSFATECNSELYPQDIVYYDINDETEGFTKGKIFRRIDTLRNNDIGTDWRHVKYDRAGVDKLLFYSYTTAKNNTIKETKLFNCTGASLFKNNFIDLGMSNVNFPFNMSNNKIGINFYNNTIEDSFNGNCIKDNVTDKTFPANYEYRTVYGSTKVFPTNTTAAKMLVVDPITKELSEKLIPTGGTTADATNSVKGIVKLSGDLGGTADAPTVPALANKENTSNKKTTLTNNDTDYPTTKAVRDAIDPQATRPLLNIAFNTNDLIDGKTQYGKEINLQNTIEVPITVKEGAFSTYFKGGAGNIKFVADTGRTLKLMDATDTINGIVGSYAKVKSFGTVDYIYINNY